jgi:hypothetical protein
MVTLNLTGEEPGMILSVGGNSIPGRSIILYSTIPIIDSSGSTANTSVELDVPMNFSLVNISAIQIFQCSQILVNQTDFVDAQSRQLQSEGQQIRKTDSTWLPYTGSDEPGPGKSKPTLPPFVDLVRP